VGVWAVSAGRRFARKRRYLGFRSRLDRDSPVAFVHSQAPSYADPSTTKRLGR
jgi:hypothetical protein